MEKLCAGQHAYTIGRVLQYIAAGIAVKNSRPPGAL